MRYFLVSSFFSLLFSLLSLSCANTQSIDESFYIGLTDKENAASHFERALSSRNPYIRGAASQELCVLLSEGSLELSARTMRQIKRNLQDTPGFNHWFLALDSVNNKEKALSFLLNIDNTVPDEARNYALNKNISLFNNQELALIYGHYSLFRFRYNEALVYYSTFQKDEKWPESPPEIFYKYPDAINDLGRAFQYTAGAKDGMNLFLKWEENLKAEKSREHAAAAEASYRLLFYAARMARRIGLNEDAIALFERALAKAPVPGQKDACIWYILDLSLSHDIDIFLENLERFAASWNDPGYFNDIFDKFLQVLASRQDWDTVIRTYSIIKEKGGAFKSSYAFVIYRIIEEGYITAEGGAEYLMDCYNASLNEFNNYLYYRAASASVLNKPLFTDKAASSFKPTPALLFLNGFFNLNAGDFLLRYIHQLENELSIDELREAADLLEKNKMYPSVIRLVTRYMKREDYFDTERRLNKRDIELLFPHPFKELIDKYAEEYNIGPHVLFGLLRTESAFQHEVVSHAGAVGLAQLMPDTAGEMAGRLKRADGPDYTNDNFNLTDPEQNIHLGAFYLNYLNDRFEDELLSLLSYNGGMNRIRRLPLYGILPSDLFMETVNITETREYGKKVLGAAAVYKALYY